jgi:hypothetical protein
MGTGYTRKDTVNNIADGNIINASDLDLEFDGVQAAFDAATGHTHDGTTGEGAPIEVTGPAQEYVSTNTELRPKANNTYDLGSASNQWKDLYVDGTANLDTVDIDAGSIDGTTIGAATPAAGTFTTAAATTGNITTVNATTVDTTNIEVTNIKAKDGTAAGSIADSTGVVTIASSVLTTTDINGGTIDGTTIGGASAAAGTFTTATATTGNITTVNATTVDSTNVEVTNIKAKDGTASATIADSTGVMTIASSVLTTADINGGTIDGVTIGGASAGAGTFTTVTTSGNLTVNGNTTLGNAATDTVTITADVASNIIPSADNTYDLGASGSEWKDLYIDGTANIDSLVADTADINGGTIDGTVIGGASAAAGTFTNVTASGTINFTGATISNGGTVTTVDINGGTIDGVTIGGASAGAATFTSATVNGNITVTGTVDGRDVAADGSKLDGIEALADVTDTTNVTAAGALMDSELTDIAAVKALDQGVATTDSPTFVNLTSDLDLSAIAATKAVTAVDVFVYDTSKDSDGGAWRKRTQNTSWYNETLNTATRGARREFPAVAVIVAEAANVTIYDGDDPSLPMWHVEDYTGLTIRAAVAINGQIWIGTSTGVIASDYAGDDLGTTTLDYTTSTTPAIVNNSVNDVAATVLPDAPIDPATGLPVPTIAVATGGGVSVIKDDGTVVNSASTRSYSDLAILDTFAFHAIWGAGESTDYFSNIKGLINSFATTRTFNSATVPKLNVAGQISTTVSAISGGFVQGTPSSKSLNMVSLNPSSIPTSLVAYTTSTYNTGWMNGDIKGAFLSDTDDTDLVASGELVTNGTFDTDTDWFKDTGWEISTGKLRSVSGANGSRAYRAITTVVGSVYRLSVDVDSVSGAFFVNVVSGNENGPIIEQRTLFAGVRQITFVANSTTTVVVFQDFGASLVVDNVSVKLADADRSVNNNGLIVNGTVTRSPVATGADLVAYSGFSASNYLEQPYNADLDFGTGDFAVMGWAKSNTVTSSTQSLVSITDGTYSLRFGRTTSGGVTHPNSIFLFMVGEGATLNLGDGSANSQMLVGVWNHVAVSRSSGTTTLWFNGNSVRTSTSAYGDFVTTGSTLRLGSGFTVAAYEMAMALWRISATAPTADQIKKIYNDEKFLFQDGAQATLYGASDAVTALAHDSTTDLLHVGTSAGRSVFQGLRRVSNTTTAVGTAISASNGLIAEE